ncbi:hypothetical protein PR048_028771 [Dryococelus australis]|uniref:Uncharacterized protein n=1 Tax=Dryococelus australis TaxID=614101 RepID=A0ABQ9GBY0_9NEOP|nr:hypothetical protein PR048_028771 [Dryococelus australis]
MKGRGKREIPEKTCRPKESSRTILTFENPGVTPPEIEPGLPSMNGALLPDAPMAIAMSQYSLHVDSMASLALLSSALSLAVSYDDTLTAASPHHLTFIDTHKTPHDRVKLCRERKINIKASERVSVDVFTQDKRP